jgi:hypothetical protein
MVENTLEVPFYNAPSPRLYLHQHYLPAQYLPTIPGLRIILHGNPIGGLQNYREIQGTLVILDSLHCGKTPIMSGTTGNTTDTKTRRDICGIESLKGNALICITLRMSVNGNESA